MAADEENKGGRPTKYCPELAHQAESLCKLGATDREIAEFFGISEATVRRWQSKHEEFAEAVKVGKGLADARVEQSLYRRATGYSFDAEEVFCDAKTGKVTRVPYVEHVPPDTRACEFWLKNRKPAEWRDRIDVAVTDEPAEISDEPLSPEEWERRYCN